MARIGASSVRALFSNLRGEVDDSSLLSLRELAMAVLPTTWSPSSLEVKSNIRAFPAEVGTWPKSPPNSASVPLIRLPSSAVTFSSPDSTEGTSSWISFSTTITSSTYALLPQLPQMFVLPHSYPLQGFGIALTLQPAELRISPIDGLHPQALQNQ